jgi:hypothetical protein
MQNQEKGRRKFMAKMGLGTLAIGMGNVGAYAFAPKNEITKKTRSILVLLPMSITAFVQTGLSVCRYL